MAAEKVYYLSPHADDVALSCGGSLLLDVAAGRAVTLITIFLSGPDAARRQLEDRQAAALLGVDYQCLDLPDAIDRPEVRGRLDVFMPFGPPHLGITNEVVCRLERLIAGPATVISPLAVGGHIDHRVVHEAARALAYGEGRSLALAFYEDLPYSLSRYSLGRRLATLDPQLGTALPGLERAPLSTERAAYRAELGQWPLFQRGLPGLRQLGSYLVAGRAVAADLGGQRPGFAPRLRPIRRQIDGVLARRRQAIAAYASQWPLFAPTVDELCQRLEAYGRSSASDGSIGEQQWYDDGVYGPAAG